jgi:hypothetical protein
VIPLVFLGRNGKWLPQTNHLVLLQKLELNLTKVCCNKHIQKVEKVKQKLLCVPGKLFLTIGIYFFKS